MSLFKKPKAGGFMDEIRCDESSYLIWKWHPYGSVSNYNNRENAIRWGSSLRVKDGEVAVFVYDSKNGVNQDYIIGPFDKKIETDNLPVLASIIGLAYDGGTPFQAEVYFINLAQIIQIKFGVPYFEVFDSKYTEYSVPVAVRGTISFSISDYKEFIKLHRLNAFDLDDFKIQIRDAISRYIKDIVINVPSTHNIQVIQLESKIGLVNDEVELYIRERLKENFGVTVSGVDISAIEIDKTSDNYYQLMSITKEVTSTKIQAETKDYVERLRIQREEGQYALHKQTESSNLTAFQIEKHAEVGIAGAHALGKMGENGAGNIDLGDGGTGFNMAGIMTAMSIGGAVGQNIAGSMNNMMSNTNNLVTPPPLNQATYYIAVNNQPNGPYEMNHIQQMIINGQINSDTLVWKNGMENWSRADMIDELKNFFASKIPPIPSQE